jgi:hypothetical protein
VLDGRECYSAAAQPRLLDAVLVLDADTFSLRHLAPDSGHLGAVASRDRTQRPGGVRRAVPVNGPRPQICHAMPGFGDRELAELRWTSTSEVEGLMSDIYEPVLLYLQRALTT